MVTRRAALVLLLGASLFRAASTDARAWQAPKGDGPYRPTEAEREAIAAKAAELGRALESARAGAPEDAVADVEVARKAAEWALRHGDFFEPRDVARAHRVLDRGLERARALASGGTPRSDADGGSARGYRSRIDGSVQPYAVVVPPGARDEPRRLDVVLHGRDGRISEVRFLDAHEGKPASEGQQGLVLHVYGRGNNAYRWAGEADVFEAIEAVRRNYKVDDRRIVLRGFSMGGAGAWHLGLHHPSRWSSVEAGAGFTETARYAKLKDPSETTLKLLHIYDAVDYARNAFDVPIAGYGGEKDSQAQASLNILEALEAQGVPMKADGLVTTAEGLDFRRIVGEGMGHAVDKVSARLLADFHDARAAMGVDPLPARIRFVTYTLKYPRVGWLEVLRLDEHYTRATLDAERADGLATVATTNVAALAVSREAGDRVRLDGREFLLRGATGDDSMATFRKGPEGWRALDADEARAMRANQGREKATGVQGPIDDAFTGPFLCVRGTGRPADPRVHEWAEARLARFAEEWSRWMRGDLPIKDDTAVTEDDLRDSSLILFGDPGSNTWIKALAPEMGLTWTGDGLKVKGETHPATGHAPALIQANPRNPKRYVVVNAGHTFGDREFRGTNALLYPHLPDFAVYKVGPDEEVVQEGFFNERWK